MAEEEGRLRRSRRVAVPQGKYREMADEDEQQFDDDGSDASVKMDVDEDEDEDEDEDIDVDEDEEQESPETRRQPKRPRTAMPRKQSARSRAGTPASAQRQFLRVREDIRGDDDLDEEDARVAEQIIRESLGRADEISGRIQEFGEEMAESLFLDGPEGYFDQHKRRPNGSGTPFSRAPKIEYEDFARYVRESKEIHAEPRAFIASLYHTMFPQWSFELSQGFNLLFYGVGSKRSLVMEFVEQELEMPTLVTNGYNPAVTVKEVLNNCLSVLVPAETSKTFPKTPTELLNAMVRYMDAERPAKAAAQKPAGRFGHFELCLVIHNLDGEAIRTDKEQALLARLAAIPEIMVIATVDNINAPVLWDAARLAQFNFLWHDMTTFEYYTVETGHDDALALGRNRTTVGTKGAKYVLASLTAKARSLFELLASQQLETMNEQAAAVANGKSGKSVPPVGTAAQGTELRVFYKQCVEHFIVANEANFRTMLGEFVEHKMVNITKDATGAEIIYIPFTVDALEEAIEDLASM